jgi:hypothetical protein
MTMLSGTRLYSKDADENPMEAEVVDEGRLFRAGRWYNDALRLRFRDGSFLVIVAERVGRDWFTSPLVGSAGILLLEVA